MRVDIVSVLPEVFDAPLSASMIGIARERGLLDVHVHDLRDWALPGVHRQVDDAPYGGGPGMVMRPEPLSGAIRDITGMDGAEPVIVLTDPGGERLDQALVEELAAHDRLLVVCGRYEGVDERVRSLVHRSVSIGDYVLTGGELPAMVLVDAVSRLIPGVLGGETSAEEESFTWGLLEYPQYTRPARFEGMEVPEVLLSGDHARVARWRREQAIERTARLRPDLLEDAELDEDERALARRLLGRESHGNS
jgi:tRNA (guanine37-N1)-methyltransferase